MFSEGRQVNHEFGIIFWTNAIFIINFNMLEHNCVFCVIDYQNCSKKTGCRKMGALFTEKNCFYISKITLICRFNNK